MLGDDGLKFRGKAVISGGLIELASKAALGSGYVEFVASSTASAVLQIDRGDAPRAGGAFANTLSNFSDGDEAVDLRSIAFASGATAVLTGSTLELSDGGKTYSFNVAGGTDSSYQAVSDGQGGTLIQAGTTAAAVVVFAQTAAAFAPAGAAQAALVSGGASSGLTPLLHATASAGRL